MTLTLTPNERKLIRGVKHAVEARGRDWKYPERKALGETSNWYDEGTCVNKQLNGDAGCIVGFAAMDAGLNIAREGGVSVFVYQWGMEQNGPLALALMEAQGMQDHQATWGEAFDHFEAKLIELGMTREMLDAIYAEFEPEPEAVLPTEEEILALLDFRAPAMFHHIDASCPLVSTT